MNLLIISQHYAPEEVSGSVLGTELATSLVQKQHQVTYLTCAPNYPLGKLFPGYKNDLFSQKMLDGVRVVRVWSYISKKKTFWRRIFSYGSFSISAFFGGVFLRKPDIILSFSPPLPLGIAAWALSRIWHVPWILNVMDIYPEIAVVTGVLKSRSAIRFFEALEKFLYRKATHIQVLSGGFRNNLLQKGVPGEKISIIPVWADPKIVSPGPKENPFRQENDLVGKFVVMYSGNLGVNSSLEDVILAADLLRSEQNICFVVIGEGVRKEELIKMGQDKNLVNVQFLPFQPREKFNMMLAAADIGLVTLSADAHHTSLPSKTFNIMASGRPLLAVTPVRSEIASLLAEHNCGVVVPPGKPEQLAHEILQLSHNPELTQKMGRNGREQLEAHFSRQHCVDLFDQDFQRLMQRK